MGHGGARKGAGRPRKHQGVTGPFQSAHDYAMAVVNDNTAAPARRDRMAITLLRCCHQPIGKKEAAMRAAQEAAVGWGDLLQPEPMPPKAN